MKLVDYYWGVVYLYALKKLFTTKYELILEKDLARILLIVVPEKVVKKALKTAKKGRDMSVCSFYVKCPHLNVKLLPQKLTMKIWLHGIKKYL